MTLEDPQICARLRAVQATPVEKEIRRALGKSLSSSLPLSTVLRLRLIATAAMSTTQMTFIFHLFQFYRFNVFRDT